MPVDGIDIFTQPLYNRRGSVGWGWRIYWLHLCKSPGYDTKQSDGEVPVMLEPRRMRSTPLLPSLPGSLWPRVVAPDKGPIYGSYRTK